MFHRSKGYRKDKRKLTRDDEVGPSNEHTNLYLHDDNPTESPILCSSTVQHSTPVERISIHIGISLYSQRRYKNTYGTVLYL